MHRLFKKLLEDATGISEFVIVVNVDIRGFSPFSKQVESPDVAMFIKKVYAKLIDDYFPDASFFKSTGDGLLITIPYKEEDLRSKAEKTIDSCFRALTDFGAFCTKDPMINFEVPTKLGIGLSRGTACRLVSKEQTLDYSGRVLNLASRLMDFARPTGIVFDAGFDIELLSDEQIKSFAKDAIYIKGIAPERPVEIYYTKELTRILPLNKQPLDKVKWDSHEETLTLRKIKEYPALFHYFLETEPLDFNQVKVKVSFPGVVRGRKRKDFIRFIDFSNFEYSSETGKPVVVLDFASLAKRLETNGVKDDWKVNIEITYPSR